MTMVDIPEAERPFFGKRPVKSRHNLAGNSAFCDEEVARILDETPSSAIKVWQCGTSPTRFADWQPVQLPKLSGQDIVACVKRGRLWVNIQRVDLRSQWYADLTKRLYGDLSDQCAHFKPLFMHTYLLVSSPGAFVYLHMDSYENFFWCLRGSKKFHLYPPRDRRMISQQRVEDICSGAEDFFQWEPLFDQLKTEVDVSPGDMMSWPQHSPHQVFNLEDDSLTVGLGTFHGTGPGIKMIETYCASKFFRDQLPAFRKSLDPERPSAPVQRATYRLARRAKRIRVQVKHRPEPQLRLDPEAGSGVSPLR